MQVVPHFPSCVTKNVSRYYQMVPEYKIIPSWEPLLKSWKEACVNHGSVLKKSSGCTHLAYMYNVVKILFGMVCFLAYIWKELETDWDWLTWGNMLKRSQNWRHSFKDGWHITCAGEKCSWWARVSMFVGKLWEHCPAVGVGRKGWVGI